jgi:hypothetical protein
MESRVHVTTIGRRSHGICEATDWSCRYSSMDIGAVRICAEIRLMKGTSGGDGSEGRSVAHNAKGKAAALRRNKVERENESSLR